MEDNSIREGKVFYDIRFSARVPGTKEPIRLIVNLEAQKNKIFAKRHYEKIRKVVSIWIQMSVDQDVANTITEYSIAEKNIVCSAKGKKEDDDLKWKDLQDTYGKSENI